jgi:hypothetical protein
MKWESITPALLDEIHRDWRPRTECGNSIQTQYNQRRGETNGRILDGGERAGQEVHDIRPYAFKQIRIAHHLSPVGVTLDVVGEGLRHLPHTRGNMFDRGAILVRGLCFYPRPSDMLDTVNSAALHRFGPYPRTGAVSYLVQRLCITVLSHLMLDGGGVGH